MKLFLIHCGYYDEGLFNGAFESHVNFFLIADSVEAAKAKAKLNEAFKEKRMHIDGIQEISMVDGYEIALKKSIEDHEKSVVTSHLYRGLAPKKAAPSE
jgi:hypothetical protein